MSFATDGDPMRRVALEVVPSHVERAYCPWCSSRLLSHCNAPAVREPSGSRPWCFEANRDGRCGAFTPSVLTRLLRVVGRRGPVLIEAKP